MSKKEKATVALIAALVGQALLGKVAKEQGAALGMSVLAVGILGYAVSYALA